MIGNMSCGKLPLNHICFKKDETIIKEASIIFKNSRRHLQKRKHKNECSSTFLNECSSQKLNIESCEHHDSSIGHKSLEIA